MTNMIAHEVCVWLQFLHRLFVVGSSKINDRRKIFSLNKSLEYFDTIAIFAVPTA